VAFEFVVNQPELKEWLKESFSVMLSPALDFFCFTGSQLKRKEVCCLFPFFQLTSAERKERQCR